jgi:hypothetical protein
MEEVTQMLLAEDDDMVETFPPDRANQSFRMVEEHRTQRSHASVRRHAAR